MTERAGGDGAGCDPVVGDPADLAASLLESLGLPSSPLQVADGWVNRVWLAPAHVVRLSSGRFRDSLAHEARVLRLLPPEVPHARVVAHRRTGRREWLVLERVPGITLTAAWPALARCSKELRPHRLLVRAHRCQVARNRAWRSGALSQSLIKKPDDGTSGGA